MAITTNVPSNNFEDLQRDVQDATRFTNATAPFTNRVGLSITPIPMRDSQLAAKVAEAASAVEALGWFPVAGSFTDGGTITARNQVLFNGADSSFYSWSGALPKVVPAASTPASTGGISANAWVDRNEAALRSALADHNSTVLVGGVEAGELSDMALNALNRNKLFGNQSSLRFLSNIYNTTNPRWSPIYIVGDSISEGTDATDYHRDGWAGIFNLAMQKFTGLKSWGFVNLRRLNVYGKRNYHSVDFPIRADGVTRMFNDHPAPNFDNSNFGGVKITSSTAGDYIDITFTGKQARLVYRRRDGGGSLRVYKNGVADIEINTATVFPAWGNDGAYQSGVINFDQFGENVLRVEKLDANLTELIGVIYAENLSNQQPIVYNVSRSSIALNNIPDAILNAYAESGTVILALGVNDNGQSASVSEYERKLRLVADVVRAKQGGLLFLDFLVHVPESNPYKIAMKTVSKDYPEFSLIDFKEFFFDDVQKSIDAKLWSADQIHPTIQGQELIAKTVLNAIGIPYNKIDVAYSKLYPFTIKEFANGWGNFGSNIADRPTIRREGDSVLLSGFMTIGTSTANTLIVSNLPSEFRPMRSRRFLALTSGGFMSISIRDNGSLVVESPPSAASTWVSLDGVCISVV